MAVYNHYNDTWATSGTSNTTTWATGGSSIQKVKAPSRALKPFRVKLGNTLLEQLQDDFRRVTGIITIDGQNIYPYMADLPRTI